MIRRIRGKLLERGADSIEVLAGDGLGYALHVPLGSIDRLPARGEEVELHTVQVVRDDAIELYGFVTDRERELFRRLRTASGVGPRLALAVLGALPSDRIVAAIRSRDHATLQTVSGVGKKTAERIAIELADKLDDLESEGLQVLDGAGPTAAAVQALKGLGYAQMDADAAVRRAVMSLDGQEVDTQELVKHALQFV